MTSNTMSSTTISSATVSRSRRLQFYPNNGTMSIVDEIANTAAMLENGVRTESSETGRVSAPLRLLGSEDDESERGSSYGDDQQQANWALRKSGSSITEGSIRSSTSKNKFNDSLFLEDANEDSDTSSTTSATVAKIMRDRNKSFRERYRLSSYEDDDNVTTATSTGTGNGDVDDVITISGNADDKLRSAVIDDDDLLLFKSKRPEKVPVTTANDADDEDDDATIDDLTTTHPCSPVTMTANTSYETEWKYSSSEVAERAKSLQAEGYTPALRLRDIIDQYVVIADYTPDSTQVGSIALREGQIVEVLDSNNTLRWMVRTRPSKYLSPRQGWIPSTYLEKKTAETTLRSLQNIMDLEYEIRSDSKEREAAQKRRGVIKELVETEEEFVKDMQHVVNTYLNELDNPRLPKELRDQREAIFLNFKQICDFHNNVLIKGVQYYAGEPHRLGTTFLRLERDFDMHARYCQEEPQAQALLGTSPVKEFFEEYSKRIGEINKSLSDHLKLPIQRINDYQLLLKELIKYTSRLKEDCTELQKALELMLSIPQRAHDLKFINAIEGFKGNIHKLGRLLRHQDWFAITESDGRTKERYLFLFKSRIFVTKVKKLSETKSKYILKDIIRLSDVEIHEDLSDSKTFEFHHKIKGQPRYPLRLEAQSELVKDAWLKELREVNTDIALASDLSEDGIESTREESQSPLIDENQEEILFEPVTEPISEVVEEVASTETVAFAEEVASTDSKISVSKVSESKKSSVASESKIEEDRLILDLKAATTQKRKSSEKEEATSPKVQALNSFDEEQNTVLTEGIQSGSATPMDANEFQDGTSRPRFRKSLKGATCIRGDTATLECELVSVPSATVAWLKDNVPLSEAGQIEFVVNGNTHYLVVKDTDQKDSGLYTCRATNTNGAVSCSAQLNVQEPGSKHNHPISPGPKAPEFTIHFKDTELLEGTSVRFLVKVRANPDAEVKFTKNGEPLKQDERVQIVLEDCGTMELSIGHVTFDDAGTYGCVAKNPFGENSISANVTVTSEKDIFQGAKKGLLQPGEEPDFKWFRDGQEIEGSDRLKVLFKDEEDTLALVFQHVKPEDAGLYTCVASTSSGRIACSAELTVQGSVQQVLKEAVAPQITAELIDSEVSVGTSAMLEVKVTGFPKPKLTWSKDGKEIKIGGRFKFLHEDDESVSLVIKGVTQEDAGQYTVKAKNELGEVSTSGALLVKAAPTFKKQLTDVSVMNDQTVKFDVEVEGQPPPEVTWFKDGKAVEESERLKITDKGISHNLTITKTIAEDAGSYSCVASNSSGKMSEFAKLTVNAPPQFLKEIKSIETREEDDVKFEVKVVGFPEPSVKWMRNGEVVKEDGSHIVIEKDDKYHTLAIHKTSRRDSGKYTCEVTNVSGSVSGTGSLIVNSVPQFVKPLQNIIVKEDDTFIGFEVYTSGFPKPTITWFIESTEITESNNKFKIEEDGTHNHVLRLKKADFESRGKYSCKITNAHGEAHSECTLDVHTIPRFTETIKDLEVTEGVDVTYSVKLTGNPKPNVVWTKDHQEVNVSANIKLSEAEGGVHTLTLTGVTEESAGSYQCKASNSEGDAVTISKLVVNTHPRFDGEIKSIEVWNGESATLESVGISIPYPEVKWFKDGEQLTDSKELKITDDGKVHRIHIKKTVPEDTGVYKIELSNKIGTASQEGRIRIKASTEASVPVLMKKLDDVVLIEGSHATYEAKIFSNPDAQAQWYKDGTLIQENDHYEITQNDIKHTYKLIIKNTSPKDVGRYTLKAVNANGEVSTDAALEVQVAPIIQEIKDKKAMPDSAVFFETKIIGTPRPVVKWLKGTTQLAESNKISFEADEVAGVYRLHLKKLVPEDGGQYSVSAENVANTASLSFNLSVTTEPPRFIKGLQNTGGKLNSPLKLEVHVYGLPMPSVKWFSGDKQLVDSDDIKLEQVDERNFSLTIRQFSEQYSATYTCKAYNQGGEAVSSGVISLTKGLPEFLKKVPKEVCIIDGEPIVLEAKLDNNPMPKVQWQKDGKNISPDERVHIEQLPDGTCRLSIDNGVPEDKGRYSLVATNDAGQTSSTGQVVVEAVPKPPSFLKKLENADVPEGGTLKLSAKVTAHPKPVAKWLKNGKPIKLEGRTKLLEDQGGNFGLEIDDVKPEDEGKYTLQVSNHQGEASSESSVTVKTAAAPPEFGQPLKSANAIEGAPSRLEAKVRGSPSTYKWYKDGVPYTPDETRVKCISRPDGTVALLFEKTKPSDAGKYTLEAVNPHGSAKSDGNLSVSPRENSGAGKKAPKFISPISSLTVDEGKPFKLVAQIEGNPYPDITWLRDDQPLKMSDVRFFNCDGDKISMELRKAIPKDGGVYTCKLVNPEGEASSEAKVAVNKLFSTPNFTQRFTDLFTIPGGDPRFIGRVSGVPKPDISWYFNDQPIFDSPKYKIRRDDDLCALQVKGATAADKGRYTCRASNDAGGDACSAGLDITDAADKKDRADPPSFLKKLGDCSAIEGMAAKFTACVAGFPEPTFKWFKDGRELLKDPADRVQIQVEAHGLLRLVVKGAKPQDLGKYTLKISNPHGEAESSAQLIFDNYEEKAPRERMADLNIDHDKFRRSAIPFALPDKPIISKMTDRRLTLSWKPYLPNGPGMPVTYIVDMCEATDGDWFSARQGIRGCCCEIRNLEPFHDYKFRVRVENKYGVSDPSPYATAYRPKLEMTPPRQLPRLPTEIDFRPETSIYFPKDYDIDRPLHEEYAHAPRFLRPQDDHQYCARGEPASVEWWVYGYPIPEVRFNFGDTVINNREHYEWASARNGQCKLYISVMTEREVGTYECIATNEHGEARQRIKVAMAEHPEFIMHLDEENILLRQSGTLSCRVIGAPYPEIKWFKDWKPIVASNRIKIEWKEPDLCTLTISDSIHKDGGLYSCVARNIGGTATSSAMVHIEEDENNYDYLKYSHSRLVRAHPSPFENSYDIGDEIGRGTQGTVYHAVERSTGNSYAAKVMHVRSDTMPYARRELDIMNQLHNRHLIRARDAFETKNSVTLVTDLAAGGELFETICKQTTITESEIAGYIRQILWGLDHMHNKGIGHLGLTPGDILLSKPGGDDIKICDFGLASRIIKGKDHFLNFGMPEFVAPEVVHLRPVTFSTDMWSVGVITYLLLSGISPFLGETDRETLKRIQKGQLTFDSNIFTNVSDEAKDFLSKLLVFDSEGRMDVKTSLKHPWLRYADRIGSGNVYSTDRLRDYYKRYRDWMRNSACHRFYRRRPLSYAFDHPSGMLYPPGEDYTPPESPEASPAKSKPDWSSKTPLIEPPKEDRPTHVERVEDREHEDINYDLGYADSNSQYQNGPDTYLLQLRDVGFPLRLREYMRLSAACSPTLAVRLHDNLNGQIVTVRERRRFTDVMDEEIDDEKKGQLDGVRRRINSEISPRSETKNRIKELLPRSRENERAPFFLEKLQDTPLIECEPTQLSCLVIGEPKPTITWYRNDVLMSESHRVKTEEDAKGRCFLKFNPAKGFDSGVYKVVARNPAGEIACRARLKVGDTPGKPDGLEFPQISDSEVLITWHPPKFDGNAPIISYNLEYKEIEEAVWHLVANNIDHRFMAIRNLKPSSQYHFRVRAMNRFGWGDYSNVSATINTNEPGSAKIQISRAMKHQQEATESGKQIALSERRRSIDYSIELEPIQLSTGAATDKYSFVSELSRGRFSVVIKCCRRDGDQEVFAAKLLECNSSTEESVQNEYEIFRKLRHERIPLLHEAFRQNDILVLVQEKLQGYDILTYLTRNQEYAEDTVARTITQVLDALEYLHFRSIVHLDVQPDNVVVSDLSSGHIKLVDFGSAQVLSKYIPTKADKRDNLDFLAPELVSQADVSPQSDVWSVGVLMYILLSGVSPFVGENRQETTENIMYVRYRFEHIFKEVTPEATRFLMAIFKKTPKKRPTADECLELKWLNPSEFILKKRERSVFQSSKLQAYAEEYHKQRQLVSSKSENLLNACGTHFSRSVSVEYDTLTTF